MNYRSVYLWLMYILVVMLICLGPTSLGAFIDPPSMCFIVGLVSCCMLFAFGWKKYWQFFKATLFIKTQEMPEKDLKIFIKMADLGINVTLYCGAFAVVIGVVQMLQDLSDPQALGVGAATALLTLFYAFGIEILFFYPAKYHFLGLLNDQLIFESDTSRKSYFLPGMLFLPLGALFFALLPFPRLMADSGVQTSPTMITFSEIRVHVPGTEGKAHLNLEVNLTFKEENDFVIQGLKHRENVLRSLMIDTILKYDRVTMDDAGFSSKLKDDFKNFLDKYLEKEFSEKGLLEEIYFSRLTIDAHRPGRIY